MNGILKKNIPFEGLPNTCFQTEIGVGKSPMPTNQFAYKYNIVKNLAYKIGKINSLRKEGKNHF